MASLNVKGKARQTTEADLEPWRSPVSVTHLALPICVLLLGEVVTRPFPEAPVLGCSVSGS